MTTVWCPLTGSVHLQEVSFSGGSTVIVLMSNSTHKLKSLGGWVGEWVGRKVSKGQCNNHCPLRRLPGFYPVTMGKIFNRGAPTTWRGF